MSGRSTSSLRKEVASRAKLRLTDSDLVYTGLYDSSNAQVVKGAGLALGSFAATGGHVSYFHNTDTEFSFTLLRATLQTRNCERRGS